MMALSYQARTITRLSMSFEGPLNFRFFGPRFSDRRTSEVAEIISFSPLVLEMLHRHKLAYDPVFVTMKC